MVSASIVFSTFSELNTRPLLVRMYPRRCVDIERRQGALDIDDAEPVTLALLDGEGDEEAAAVAVEIGGRRDDADIGISVLHVELPAPTRDRD